MKRYFWFWLLGLVALLWGLSKGEARILFIHARMICLSCIGVG